MIEIVVDTSSLNRQQSGSITGRIWIRNGKEAFPEEEWSDFPVVILSWWIDGLRDLVAGRTMSFEGEFMDGDFAYVVESGVISWKEGERKIPAEIVDIQSMLQSAILAGKIVVLACRKSNWINADIEKLEYAVSQSMA